jgi:hypothetical protein
MALQQDQTADEIAAHYVAMGHSVTEITGGRDTAGGETADEWTLRKARNVDHLVLQKASTHEDDSSWWTSESFTAIDAAIAS